MFLLAYFSKLLRNEGVVKNNGRCCESCMSFNDAFNGKIESQQSY